MDVPVNYKLCCKLQDDVLLSEEGTQQASGDNREDSRTESDDESSSESTMLVTLKRNALEG